MIAVPKRPAVKAPSPSSRPVRVAPPGLKIATPGGTVTGRQTLTPGTAVRASAFSLPGNAGAQRPRGYTLLGDGDQVRHALPAPVTREKSFLGNVGDLLGDVEDLTGRVGDIRENIDRIRGRRPPGNPPALPGPTVPVEPSPVPPAPAPGFLAIFGPRMVIAAVVTFAARFLFKFGWIASIGIGVAAMLLLGGIVGRMLGWA